MTRKEFLAFSLPYELCVISECDLDNRDYDEICIYKPYHYTDEFIEKFITSDVQLAILHPLTDLTKEIEHNGETFVPIVELAKISYPEHYVSLYVYRDGIIRAEIDFEDYYVHLYFDGKDFVSDSSIQNQFKLFQKLIEWHFDTAGLIEKGEAIDVNTLPENPYK